MKILVLATDICTRGGIARYTWTLASVLGELVGRENVDALVLLGRAGAEEAPKNFRILDTVAERLTPAAKIRFAGKALKHARRKYDLIICTHVALVPVAAAIGFLCRTPFWVACHSIEVWRRLPTLRLAVLKRADLALPVSRFTAEKLIAVNGIPAWKVRVLYNAIPSDFVQLLLAPDGAMGPVRIKKRDERLILSVCSLVEGNEFKGIDMVIQALPRVLSVVPNVFYAVVGGGPDRTRLERLAVEMGVSRHVTFLGEMSDLELASLYHACEVFVLPSRSQNDFGRWGGEGFGRVYAEAAFAAKPVIGSRTAGAPEAILPSRTGFVVDPLSVEEIAKAIVRLLQTPELAKRMGSEGRKMACETFSQDALRKCLRDLLRARGLCIDPIHGRSPSQKPSELLSSSRF